MTQAINLANFANQLDSSGGIPPSAINSTIGVSKGGTGTTSITGIVKGNGTSAFTTAAGTDVTSLIGTNVVTNAANLTTTNFTVQESGGNLIIKYGTTTILTISSGGTIVASGAVLANGG